MTMQIKALLQYFPPVVVFFFSIYVFCNEIGDICFPFLSCVLLEVMSL